MSCSEESRLKRLRNSSVRACTLRTQLFWCAAAAAAAAVVVVVVVAVWVDDDDGSGLKSTARGEEAETVAVAAEGEEGTVVASGEEGCWADVGAVEVALVEMGGGTVNGEAMGDGDGDGFLRAGFNMMGGDGGCAVVDCVL